MFSHRIIRFFMVGVFNTSLSYAVFSGLFFFGFSPYISAAVGYVVALIVSFFLNKSFVFQNYQVFRYAQFIKFLLFNLVMLCLSLGFLRVLIDWGGLSAYFAQAMALTLTACLSFLCYRVIFRESSELDRK